jgi:hypothetical protein
MMHRMKASRSIVTALFGATLLAQAGEVSVMDVPDGGIQPQAVVDGRGTFHLMYFHVNEVDPIAKEFKTKAIDQPRAREVQLNGPDGNRFRIGERR